MFELVKAYEIAKGEKNIFLRHICIIYTKYALKHSFFKKFDVYNMRLDRKIINEFLQLYDCVNDYSIMSEKQNTYCPYISTVIKDKNIINIQYYNYKIAITVSDIIDMYNVSISDTGYDNSDLSFHINEESINNNCIRPIILIAIYNYCVSYIYGFNSKLYIDDVSFIKYISNFYI